jgi:hypothetical protein
MSRPVGAAPRSTRGRPRGRTGRSDRPSPSERAAPRPCAVRTARPPPIAGRGSRCRSAVCCTTALLGSPRPRSVVTRSPGAGARRAFPARVGPTRVCQEKPGTRLLGCSTRRFASTLPRRTRRDVCRSHRGRDGLARAVTRAGGLVQRAGRRAPGGADRQAACDRAALEDARALRGELITELTSEDIALADAARDALLDHPAPGRRPGRQQDHFSRGPEWFQPAPVERVGAELGCDVARKNAAVSDPR